jgi:hypothetical protein
VFILEYQETQWTLEDGAHLGVSRLGKSDQQHPDLLYLPKSSFPVQGCAVQIEPDVLTGDWCKCILPQVLGGGWSFPIRSLGLEIMRKRGRGRRCSQVV